MWWSETNYLGLNQKIIMIDFILKGFSVIFENLLGTHVQPALLDADCLGLPPVGIFGCRILHFACWDFKLLGEQLLGRSTRCNRWHSYAGRCSRDIEKSQEDSCCSSKHWPADSCLFPPFWGILFCIRLRSSHGMQIPANKGSIMQKVPLC